MTSTTSPTPALTLAGLLLVAQGFWFECAHVEPCPLFQRLHLPPSALPLHLPPLALHLHLPPLHLPKSAQRRRRRNAFGDLTYCAALNQRADTCNRVARVRHATSWLRALASRLERETQASQKEELDSQKEDVRTSELAFLCLERVLSLICEHATQYAKQLMNDKWGAEVCAWRERILEFKAAQVAQVGSTSDVTHPHPHQFVVAQELDAFLQSAACF
jgi:hypothetical protein